MPSSQAYDLRRPTFSLGGISSDIYCGIPLGRVVITSGESEAVITETVSFLKTTFPGDTLGIGDKGPKVCITDDCSAGFNST